MRIHRRRFRRILWLIVGCVLWSLSTPAFAAPAKKPTATNDAFEREIAPLLVRRCIECHNPTEAKGELDLTTRSGMLQGGETGPAVVPSNTDESFLLEQIRDGEMPPEEKGPPLTKAEIASIASWIKTGARWPKDRTLSTVEGRRDWWSLKLPVRPAVPPVKNTVKDSHWVRNPIDAFISRRLAKAGLAPSPEADRTSLIRRATLDVHGLPPLYEEIRRFAASKSPGAYDKLIEQLLASPRYGERWARHWLDVVRFAETNGFETNTPRPNAWRYRDWVIEALNRDLPYDQFVVAQLAGDATGHDAATGFLVAGAYDTVKSPDVNLTLMQRQNELADMVNTTGTTFLALTVGCARCHDHKFDAIVQTDYYAMQAVFAGVRHGDRALPMPQTAEQKQQAEKLRQRIKNIKARVAKFKKAAGPKLREPVNSRINTEQFPAVEARFVRFTIMATNASEPCIDELEIFAVTANGEKPRNVALATVGAKVSSSGDYVGNPSHKLKHVNDGVYGNERSWISNQNGRGWVQIELARLTRIDRIVWGRDRNERYKDRTATVYTIQTAIVPGKWQTVASSDDRLPTGTSPEAQIAAALAGLSPADKKLARALLEKLKPLEAQHAVLTNAAVAKAYAGTFTQPGATHRLHRGDPMQKREVVAPGAIEVIGRLGLNTKTAEQKRRLALARWIASEKNPLTARVIVNRLWHYHFGRGLVSTPSDFGRMGTLPSHPELLDWLAVELIEHNWSLKHIHALILRSATYRQSSRPHEAGMKVDAMSELLWRYPPRRLEAEAIRDSILVTTGVLDLRMGGPGYDVFKPNTNYVRNYIPKDKFGPAEWRRMVYMVKVRMEQDAVFGTFDCPDAGQPSPKRSRSTTAIQALNLLNSGFMIQQAELFAARLKREAGEKTEAQVERAFQLALGRKPADEERPGAIALVKQHGLATLCRSLLNASEFLFVP